MAGSHGMAADALVRGLRRMFVVTYTPLPLVVARLDTSQEAWVLYLDSDSPPEDHCWAMEDLLRVLILGGGAATSRWVTQTPRLNVVRD